MLSSRKAQIVKNRSMEVPGSIFRLKSAKNRKIGDRLFLKIFKKFQNSSGGGDTLITRGGGY